MSMTEYIDQGLSSSGPILRLVLYTAHVCFKSLQHSTTTHYNDIRDYKLFEKNNLYQNIMSLKTSTNLKFSKL